MSKLSVAQRVPAEYSRATFTEIVRLLEQQANQHAEGAIVARHGAMTAAPTAGTWAKGDFVWNSAPSSGSFIGWVCTASGTPGTWATAGIIVPADPNADRILFWDDSAGTVAFLSLSLLSISGTTLSAALTSITNSLGGDVALNNTANYFDGPSVAQGASGTWFASGTVTVLDTAGSVDMDAKLWDGTTVIASARMRTVNANGAVAISLAGVIASPAGNIRISVKDGGSTNGQIKSGASGNSNDSTITAIRIA